MLKHMVDKDGHSVFTRYLCPVVICVCMVFVCTFCCFCVSNSCSQLNTKANNQIFVKIFTTDWKLKSWLNCGTQSNVDLYIRIYEDAWRNG